MATTSPDNLWSPDGSDGWDLTVDLAAMQNSTQAAITSLRNNITSLRNNMQADLGYRAEYRVQRRVFSSIGEREAWATASGTRITHGDVVYVGSTKYEWDSSKSEWVPEDYAWFALSPVDNNWGTDAADGFRGLSVCRRGDIAFLQGNLRWQGSVNLGNDFVAIANIPQWAQPVSPVSVTSIGVTVVREWSIGTTSGGALNTLRSRFTQTESNWNFHFNCSWPIF